MKSYLKEMRVTHYVKNLLIFTSLIFSGQFFDLYKLLQVTIGFASFCMLCSAIYIINDIRDLEKDRQHPIKCKRPIAAGQIPVRNAVILAAVLFLASAGCNFIIFNIKAAFLIFLYFALNFGYSFGLKNVPIIDIVILVSGFLIRVLYGGEIARIAVSDWLYLTVLALSFYLALGKRRNELQRTAHGETRKVLSYYSSNFLDKNMYMCLTLANVFYALWSMENGRAAEGKNNLLIWTVPLVMVICMKYSLNVEGNSDGDPVEVLLCDKWLILLCFIYGTVTIGILYL